MKTSMHLSFLFQEECLSWVVEFSLVNFNSLCFLKAALWIVNNCRNVVIYVISL